jgi:hypothetical protein
MPLVLQNIHRYFMYLAVLFIFFLGYEAWRAMWFVNPETGREAFRHRRWHACADRQRHPARRVHLRLPLLPTRHRRLARSFSSAPVTKKTWDCVSCLNRKHMLWAWLSLFWVGFADVYMRLVSMGIWTDFRFF